VVHLHGDYYLTDRDQVLAALRDPALVCPHMESGTYPWIPSTVPDPAEHARYRSILNPRFTPRALAKVTAAVQEHVAITVCPRASLNEMTIGEVTLPAGTRIVLPLQLLNLDEGIDISIAGNRVRSRPSYTFAGGPRRCLGVHLARAEVIAIVTEFLRRIPEFRTADGYSVLVAEVHRYLTHLPLAW